MPRLLHRGFSAVPNVLSKGPPAYELCYVTSDCLRAASTPTYTSNATATGWYWLEHVQGWQMLREWIRCEVRVLWHMLRR